MISYKTDEFFHHTAHYASQSRGIFTIDPRGIASSKLSHHIKGDTRAALGFELLGKGILTMSTSIPPQQLSTYSAGSYIGPTRKVPYGQLFTDIDIQFLLMGKHPGDGGAIYYALTKWQEFIAGPTSEGVAGTVISDFTGFAVRYYNDYVTDATIKVFSPTDGEQNTPEIEILLTEAYPVGIGPLHTAWSSPDTPLSATATFAYHYMQIKK